MKSVVTGVRKAHGQKGLVRSLYYRIDCYRPLGCGTTYVRRDNLVGAACVAGLLGYLVGSSRYRKVVGSAVLVAFGCRIWIRLANPRSYGVPDSV